MCRMRWSEVWGSGLGTNVTIGTYTLLRSRAFWRRSVDLRYSEKYDFQKVNIGPCGSKSFGHLLWYAANSLPQIYMYAPWEGLYQSC